jgi:hypothetical protein
MKKCSLSYLHSPRWVTNLPGLVEDIFESMSSSDLLLALFDYVMCDLGFVCGLPRCSVEVA